LKALVKRDFIIEEMDQNTGIIKASTKKKLLKPSIKIELEIKPVSDTQTSLDIKSISDKSWITPDEYEAKAEQKFINTLYKCFDAM
jgi:hypothetical protein